MTPKSGEMAVNSSVSAVFKVTEKHFKCNFFLLSPLLNYSYTFTFA